MIRDEPISCLLLAICLAGFFVSLYIGVIKTLDIADRTYYDHELGRTVYVEEGVLK